MTSSGTFSDRMGFPVPGDGQDEPADDSTQARTVSDANEENWGDLYQTAFLSDDYLDGVTVDSGTLNSRPAAGSSAPKHYLVDDGGESGDQAYLTHNDDSEWHLVSDFEQVDVTSNVTLSSWESAWVNTSAATSPAVELTLPDASGGDRVEVGVEDATNKTIISANTGQSIIGNTTDLTTAGAVRSFEYKNSTSTWMVRSEIA